MITVYATPTLTRNIRAENSIEALKMLNMANAVCVGSFLANTSGVHVLRYWPDMHFFSEYAADTLEQALDKAFDHYYEVCDHVAKQGGKYE